MSGDDAQSSDPRRDPVSQPWHSYRTPSWETISSTEEAPPPQTKPFSRLRLMTWNIDVLEQGAEIRMGAGIKYLKQLTDRTSPDEPIVIFLQEMCGYDLEQLQQADWVRKSFYVTDLTGSHWNDPYYGTTTLIDRRLTISQVFRVHYKSQFGRDGLFVDIGIDRGTKVLRLCNTHLESLIAVPPIRPGQVALAAEYLRAENVHAGVIAGDLNAIQPFDKAVHTDNDLQDAFLALGGQEGQDEGFTWGYQSNEYLMKKFGPSRMDKILFSRKLSVEALERIGVGEKVEQSKREELRKLTSGLDWITDHYGLAVTLKILD